MLSLRIYDNSGGYNYTFEKNPVLPCNIRGKIKRKEKNNERIDGSIKKMIKSIERTFSFRFSSISKNQNDYLESALNYESIGAIMNYEFNEDGYTQQYPIYDIEYESDINKSGIRYNAILKFKTNQSVF